MHVLLSIHILQNFLFSAKCSILEVIFHGEVNLDEDVFRIQGKREDVYESPILTG